MKKANQFVKCDTSYATVCKFKSLWTLKKK